MAGQAWVDWLFMLGLLGIGVTLLLGVGMRIGTAAGALMYAFMYVAVLPLENNPIVDDHLIGVISMAVLFFAAAGATWGLGRSWRRTSWCRSTPSCSDTRPPRRPAVCPTPGRRRRSNLVSVASGSASAERDAPDERRTARAPGESSSEPPRSAARRRALRRPLSGVRPRGGRTRRRRPSAPARGTSPRPRPPPAPPGRAGRRWRWPRGARAAAGRRRPRGPPCRSGRRCARPGCSRAPGRTRGPGCGSPPAARTAACSASSKIVPRIALMVSSSVETVSSSRRATSGDAAMEATPWSCSPVAKSRWMTTSCRSRAMRSRSESRASSWRSVTACPRSRARAAWSAKVASISRSLASCSGEVRSKTAASAVTGARWARSGRSPRRSSRP